ncbi:MAG: hypothetical protein LBU87_06930 [Lactobacillales bacterium]|jgi:hypothetical protein|nr:hypothetical protein [Lactobacillales bacterium]
MSDFEKDFNPEEILDKPPQDLLSQIAGEDEIEEVQKDKTSLLMSLFVGLMRATFFIDELRRKNQKLFYILSSLWAFLLGLIYIGGICSLFLMMYSYSQFPKYIREYFEKNDMSVQNLEILEYSFSKVELRNLKDAKDTYHIKSLVINSTFSDFLQRRVKSVLLDGVTIKISETKEGLDFGNLPRFLLRLNHMGGDKSVKIDTLGITNAKLEINGKNYAFPINFSLNGIYEKNTNISIPFSTNEKDFQIIGHLDIKGTYPKMEWELTIDSGVLSLPKHSPENIRGVVKVQTDAAKVGKIGGNLEFSYGSNSRKFSLNLNRDGDLFKGALNYSYTSVDPYDKSKELVSSILVDFDGLDIQNINKIESNRPIRIDIPSYYQPGILAMTGMNTSLNGVLSCKDFSCSYQATQAITIKVQDITLYHQMNAIKSTQVASFILQPNSSRNKITASVAKDRIDFDLSISKLEFTGYKNSPNNPLAIQTTGSVSLRGNYISADNKVNLSVNATGVNYSNIDQDLTRGNLRITDAFGEKSQLRLNGDIVLKNNTLLKIPAQISLEKTGDDTKAVVSLAGNKIRISFAGLSRLQTGEFVGNVYVYPFKLQDLGMSVHEISDLFPGHIQNPSGSIAAVGQIIWNGPHQVAGPLYVSLDDVAFNLGDAEFKGVNSVITLQSLVPLITAANQNVFIASVESILPFRNVLATFKLDTRFVRLASLSVNVAGIQLESDSLLIPHKMDHTILYLNNKRVMLDTLTPYFKKAGLSLSGVGSIVLPIEVRGQTLGIKNGEIKLADVTAVYDKTLKSAPDFMSGNDAYVIRNGTLTLNTAEGKETAVEMQVVTNGRFVPSQEKKNIREIVEVDLFDVIEGAEIAPVPQRILEKQKVIMP